MRAQGKNQKTVWWNDEVKAMVERRRLSGSRYYKLEIVLQKRDLWKTRKKKES